MDAAFQVRDFLQQLRFQIAPEQATQAFVGHVAEAENMLWPQKYLWLRERLAQLHFLPAFSAVPIVALLHLAVGAMPSDRVYLNIGVWQGYSFFAAFLEQADKLGIGVDNFSEFGTPQARFYRDFKRFAHAPQQRFYEMDYQDYFARVHREQIGVYFFDGPHTYLDQLQALELADPHLAAGALILIDDFNQAEVRQASQDFLRDHSDYAVLAALPTAHNGHPTFWNGLLILQRSG